MFQGQVVGFHHQVVATKGGGLHQQGGVGVVEVGDHRVGESEVVGREDKLVGPSVVLLQQSVGAHGGLGGFDHAGAHGADMVAGSLGRVDSVAGLAGDNHLL